ncbi:cell division protein ZipA [Marinobacter salexigens]|uniref:Cell division protein ZipA n=1 Tax=Marinobacter salexigens TaxID=1925763 RepID=A0ABS6A753_9GAMM|nr:cell division protein ZipA [Marinobacter salexigens]MBU2873928.1 cell division protein ZipA [Marinobacter salexigens]
MSLREWLIAIGTLVIIGIVIDGLRRMRRARKESIAISSGMGVDDLKESPLDEYHNPELPNGGARPISNDTLEERGYVRREKPSRFRAPQQKPTRPVRETQGENTSELDEPLPNEEGVWAQEQMDEDMGESGFSSVELDELTVDTGWGAEDEELSSPEMPAEAITDVEEDTARREPQPNGGPEQPLAGANRPEAREVIVINVLARQGEDFSGVALQKLFEACGLAHGDMDIYHRHEAEDTTTPVQFSVANAVEPGTFKPNNVAAMTTPGISFFMSMPGPTNALQAFEFMLETAQCVVRNLGGELKDERRSVMTAQTIEHCRQRIREFERKQRSPRH